MVEIVNISRNTIICSNCKVADNFITRFAGLMGKKGIPDGGGLVITPCNSIHMFFMKIPLDIIFLNRDNTVLHIIENIRPWKVSKIVRNSCYVIEAAAGTIKKSGTLVGDKLELAGKVR